MGSSNYRKPKGQPDHPLPSGAEEDEGDGGEGTPDRQIELQEGLVVRLVQLDERVLHKTAKGEAVKVIDAGQDLEVHADQGRIGNVPPTRTSEVRAQDLTAGVVQEIQEDPPQVRVLLTG